MVRVHLKEDSANRAPTPISAAAVLFPEPGNPSTNKIRGRCIMPWSLSFHAPSEVIGDTDKHGLRQAQANRPIWPSGCDGRANILADHSASSRCLARQHGKKVRAAHRADSAALKGRRC